jgi:hypothetical protein
MPRRRATALLRALPGTVCHSTRAMPRSRIAQSIIVWAALVIRPRPWTSGADQTPISHTPASASNTRNNAPPTRTPSSQMP